MGTVWQRYLRRREARRQRLEKLRVLARQRMEERPPGRWHKLMLRVLGVVASFSVAGGFSWLFHEPVSWAVTMGITVSVAFNLGLDRFMEDLRRMF